MEFIFSSSTLSEVLNAVLERLVVIAFWVWIVARILQYTYSNITKEGLGKGLYMGIVMGLEAGLLISIIYYPLPQFLVVLSRKTLEIATVRWILFYLVAILWSLRVRHKESGKHGVWFVILILTTLLFGWLYDRWLGMLAMSVPVLLVYYYLIYKVAQVVLPTSNPEDKLEVRKKTRAFLMYLLGVQHPIWMATTNTGRGPEKLLDGNPTNQIGKPGIIWTRSHQVAGISKGVGSNRVDGPGLIFTDPFEAPIALVDLRMQSRVCEVHAVTKDGIKVPTVVFTAFAVDKRNSPNSRPLKRRPGNETNLNIDHGEGSFPYSSQRVLAVLSTAGINNPRRGETVDKQELFWDEWVVKQVEHVTRLAVAERNLDELWHPKNDALGASALDEIADRLQVLLAPQLEEGGIHLFTVRIVNYKIPKDDSIAQKNIKTWSSYWEQQITEANAYIEMIYREEIEKAHAYSKSILLSAIADSITRARRINESLPRHMIAQYYIHALEEYMKRQPGLNAGEQKKRIETIKEFLLNARMEDNE